MIDEQSENVIIEMQEKTENDKINRIEKAKDENLKDFFIDEDYSYGFEDGFNLHGDMFEIGHSIKTQVRNNSIDKIFLTRYLNTIRE